MGSKKSKPEPVKVQDIPSELFLDKKDSFDFPDKILEFAGRWLYTKTYNTDVGGGQATSVGEVFIDGKRFILVSYNHFSTQHIRYYDENFRYVKEVVYKLPNGQSHGDIMNMKFIDETTFVFQTYCQLIVQQVTNSDTSVEKIVFRNDFDPWDYKLQDKNIIIICACRHTLAEITYKIRICDATQNYDWTQTVHTTSALDIINNNIPYNDRLHLFMFPNTIIKNYVGIIPHIIWTDADDKTKIYHVIRYTDSNKTKFEVDRWEYIDNKMRKNTILKLTDKSECYKINMLFNKTLFHEGKYLDNIGCVLPETYIKWRERMLVFLKGFLIINKFSGDLLEIIVDYVSSLNLSQDAV